ncbi:hypothetical protein VTL71DRAFT_303 [Oculimacula yallundae]|uniref:Uncharacterized protein n=1 Tax=Oculimacula yallundae TaxID=86028 RepID=A0ABR4CZU1_9HELO
MQPCLATAERGKGARRLTGLGENYFGTATKSRCPPRIPIIFLPPIHSSKKSVQHLQSSATLVDQLLFTVQLHSKKGYHSAPLFLVAHNPEHQRHCGVLLAL